MSGKEKKEACLCASIEAKIELKPGLQETDWEGLKSELRKRGNSLNVLVVASGKRARIHFHTHVGKLGEVIELMLNALCQPNTAASFEIKELQMNRQERSGK